MTKDDLTVVEGQEVKAPETVFEIDRVAVQIVLSAKNQDGHKTGEVQCNPVTVFYPHGVQFRNLLDAAIVQAYEQAAKAQAGG